MHLPVASRVQLAALKVPVPSLVQLTVPVGMFAPLPLVTVAVQAVELSTGTEGGRSEERGVGEGGASAWSQLPELEACLASSAVLPGILWVPVPAVVTV